LKIFENIVITKIHTPKIVRFEKNQTAQKNNRDCFGLVFCQTGNLIYESYGIKYSFNPSSAFILPKGSSYFLSNLEDGIFLLIDFECDNLHLNSLTNISLSDPKAYIRDFKLLSNYFIFSDKRLKRFQLIYEILERLDSEQTQNPLFSIINYIENNFSDCSLTNKVLAEELGISEIYFRRLFFNNFGITPKQFILDIRIKKAKQLLSNNKYSVTDISERCGFASVYHFCKIFKIKTNMTPTEYANKKRIYNI